MHVPVLLHEVIEYLDPQPGDFIIDGTIDGGGHAIEIAKRIGSHGKLLGVDWDEAMIARCKTRMAARENIILAHGNYADLQEILSRHRLPRAEGLLLDLGLSTGQLESSGRGFSFLRDEPLLMTYDAARTPVARLLERISESELEGIVADFGEERYARRIARAIVEARRTRHIETTRDLAEVVERAVPKNYERGRIHPATRTFQALRIYANDELGNLKKMIGALPDIMQKNGRVAIISFHSLEDRMVKLYFKQLEKEARARILTKKPIVAGEDEARANPRSRSAKLRACIIT